MSKNRVEMQIFIRFFTRERKLSYEQTRMYPVAYKRVFLSSVNFT